MNRLGLANRFPADRIITAWHTGFSIGRVRLSESCSWIWDVTHRSPPGLPFGRGGTKTLPAWLAFVWEDEIWEDEIRERLAMSFPQGGKYVTWTLLSVFWLVLAARSPVARRQPEDELERICSDR
jgi:hypothetical protein